MLSLNATRERKIMVDNTDPLRKKKEKEQKIMKEKKRKKATFFINLSLIDDLYLIRENLAFLL